jgi:hypothetical protein
VNAARERMTAFVLRGRHSISRMRKILQRGETFPARRVAGVRITSISKLKNLAPRIEYEACLSYAQSTIIF